MKRILNYLYDLCFVIILSVFAYTFLVKIADLGAFQIKLLKIPFLNMDWIPVLTYAVPLAELAVVLLLWFNRTRLWGTFSSFFLMSVFTIYLMYLHWVSPTTPCSCGGIFEQLTFHQHLVFNFVLLACSAILIVGKPTPIKPDPQGLSQVPQGS